jgi:hypothetical protein
MADGDIIRIPFEDHRLGRHVHHDPRNREHAIARTVALPQDVRWRRRGAKLNQGNVGACTAFTGAHAMNTEPVRAAVHRRTLTDADALDIYSKATVRDAIDGQYPPDDTGSTGLAVCQELQARGLITSYEWAFGHEAGVAALAHGPLMQGTYWTEQMFWPDPDGRVRPTGSDAGGHEYLWLGLEIVSRLMPSKNRSWFFNSWGPTYGKSGYFYMTWEDHAALLARDGDLIRPVP